MSVPPGTIEMLSLSFLPALSQPKSAVDRPIRDGLIFPKAIQRRKHSGLDCFYLVLALQILGLHRLKNVPPRRMSKAGWP
jgi:hypothetical protein